MKKAILSFALILFFSGCTVDTNIETTPYFFPKDMSQMTYMAEYSIYSTGMPYKNKLVRVNIQMVAILQDGLLYELEVFDADDAIAVALEQIPLLGYFYVTSESIWQIDKSKEDLYALQSEDYIQTVGTLVAHKNQVADPLPEDEKGLHSNITIDDDICKYTSYSTLVDTGFYRSYVWREGEGLIRYWSGFGAKRDSFELYPVDDVVHDFPNITQS